jgi:hypothetical protein
MPFFSDRVLDLGLNVPDTEGNRLDICSSEPTTYAAATGSASLGNKTSLSIGAPATRTPSGRRVTVAAFSDGNVTATGTATHWAITDTVNSRLLATGNLESSQAVTNGNVFSLAAFDIGIPGAA